MGGGGVISTRSYTLDRLLALPSDTLSILRVGHSDIFDINVPGFFFKIWYQCPNSCPTFLTQILSLYDMKLRITITWIVEFFSYCVYFMWKQYWFHQIHTTKLGLGEAVWEKCFVSHLAQNFDIKCPSWWPQILISSHCSCPTLTVLSVSLTSLTFSGQPWDLTMTYRPLKGEDPGRWCLSHYQRTKAAFTLSSGMGKHPCNRSSTTGSTSTRPTVMPLS